MIDKGRLLPRWWRPLSVSSPCVYLSLGLACLLLWPQASFSGPIGGGPVVTAVSPASGVAGTLVTITGSNFDNTTAVDFGTVSAAFTFISATEITAIVPNGFSGSVAVTVTALFVGTSPANPDDLFTLAVPAISTPALSQWSMIALVLLLAYLGGFALRRRFA
jgi:IPT/TIG domain/IPTL-CTERM motif